MRPASPGKARPHRRQARDLRTGSHGRFARFVDFAVYPIVGQGPVFIRGDADGDGTFNGLADGIHLLTHGFLGGPPPGPPYPFCGSDPEPATGLGCQASKCP